MFSSILIVLKSSVDGGVVGSSGFSIGGSTGSNTPPPVTFLAGCTHPSTYRNANHLFNHNCVFLGLYKSTLKVVISDDIAKSEFQQSFRLYGRFYNRALCSDNNYIHSFFRLGCILCPIPKCRYIHIILCFCLVYVYMHIDNYNINIWYLNRFLAKDRNWLNLSPSVKFLVLYRYANSSQYNSKCFRVTK